MDERETHIKYLCCISNKHYFVDEKKPFSAAIWSGTTPALSALFGSAPWLRRRPTTAVDPTPCTANIRGVAPASNNKDL
jgi:hypothetical protein